MKAILFTLFGFCVGLAYAAPVYWAISANEPIAACVVSAVIIIIMFTGTGWGCTDSEFTTLQSVGFVAFLPLVMIYSWLAKDSSSF